MFWITASVSLKLTTPFALEIPLGRSTILNEAFCNCRRPLITGFALLPVTDAFSSTPPEERMSGFSACNTPNFTLPSTCRDRKSTRLNSSHLGISYAVFCLKKKTDYCSAAEQAPADNPISTHPQPH